jgi:pimeloyl-ACP methyl ester carboxylesterase
MDGFLSKFVVAALVIHGWSQAWYEWRNVMPLLAPGHTVTAPDMRRFGESQISLDEYDRRSFADDLFQLVNQSGLQDNYYRWP